MFRLAKKEAVKSPHEQHKLGAVVVKSGNVLSTGFNSLRPSGLLKTNTLHAEAAAILKVLKEGRLASLSGAEIYVSRFTRGGRVGLARPCVQCLELIRSCGIRRMHYTTDEGTTVTEKIN